jgi:3-hydroxyacyl-CoA dehydrogenase / enoyl-CoA hydratase / 3-hydroxybutyryl-CoA epimerase
MTDTRPPVLDVFRTRALELGPFAAGEQDSGPWTHWRMRADGDNVAWLLIDKKDTSTNILSEEVLTELDAILNKVEQDRPRALVIRSAKQGGFIAGADISEFQGVTDSAKIEARIARGHAVLDRLDRLPLPTIAVIHGYCLGGGLEVALACDYRIAIDNASFGFPEVLLGLHPGLGGTVRLTRLINPMQAMTMMLTGKTERARAAKKLGIVDAVTQERHVLNAVKSVTQGDFKSHKPGLSVSILNSAPARSIIAPRMRSEAEKKVPHRFYPAPSAVIDLWARHGGNAPAMQRDEIASFAKLLVTDTAQNLVRVFFLRNKLKDVARGAWSGKHIHVIGAGAMGGDIAAWCAWHGFNVSLADMKAEPLAGAIKRAAGLYSKIGRGDSLRVRDSLDRLTSDLKGEGVATADLIIEAVPENLELKQKIYAGIEPKMKRDAILATNTSSIPLEQLRERLQRPERLVGIHFFNPVSRMQLVEVVSHDKVAKEVLASACRFLGRIDRLPAPVKSAPGFLVNRALTPYLLEAMVMLDQGLKKETIDKAATEFGMPMGPIELADQVGLDICLHVAETLRGNLKKEMPPPPQWLKDMVDKGDLGRKSGKGFYEWKDGHAIKAHVAPSPPDDATDRLILPMIDVCVACLHEGVVADEETIDAAMIFATGFAPFRGGPMHYARSRGLAAVRERLQVLAMRYGVRFAPGIGWGDLK